MNKKVRKVMVDMSATLFYHGHIRLLKKDIIGVHIKPQFPKNPGIT